MHLLETPDVNPSSVKLPDDIKSNIKLQRITDTFIADLMKNIRSPWSNFQSARPPRWVKKWMNTLSLWRAVVKLSIGSSDYEPCSQLPAGKNTPDIINVKKD